MTYIFERAPAAFVAPLLKDAKLRALAVSADKPLTDPIQIPTAISQGIDYRYATWYGILAPAHTPMPFLTTLHQAISTITKDPQIIARVTSLGLIPRDRGPNAFDVTIHKQIADLTPVLTSIERAAAQN